LSSVDFPHPDGPSKLTNSPGQIARSTPANAAVPLAKVFLIPKRVSSGWRDLPAMAVLIGKGSMTDLRGTAAFMMILKPFAAESFASCRD
jgi:hypothetical protein